MHPSKIGSWRSVGIQEDLCKKMWVPCWALRNAAVRRITIVIRRTAALENAQHEGLFFLHKSSWMPADRPDPTLLGCILLQSWHLGPHALRASAQAHLMPQGVGPHSSQPLASSGLTPQGGVHSRYIINVTEKYTPPSWPD